MTDSKASNIKTQSKQILVAYDSVDIYSKLTLNMLTSDISSFETYMSRLQCPSTKSSQFKLHPRSHY